MRSPAYGNGVRGVWNGETRLERPEGLPFLRRVAAGLESGDSLSSWHYWWFRS
jgi:hypothetical protein